MSQTFTDNCYQSDHVAVTDMANIEANFAALKSCFSGASAPSNLVAGMWWFDTTANILKIRDESNSAWQNVYDLANSRAYSLGITITAGSGLSGGGILTADRTISHAAHTGDVTGTTALTIANSIVSQAKLKTTTVSGSITGTNAWQTLTLTGAEYGFIPRVRISNTAGSAWFRWHDYSTGYQRNGAVTFIQTCQYRTEYTSHTAYIEARYVNSSGEIFWVFGLVDKRTQKTISFHLGENHPCFGNGQDPSVLQQPFVDYDKDRYQLCVANPPEEQLNDMRKLAVKRKWELNDFIMRRCDFDLSRSAKWPAEKVSVGYGAPKMIIPKVDDALVVPLKLNGN